MQQPKLISVNVTLTITGSRDIEDKDFVYKCLNDFLKLHNLRPENLTLNSGHARGVDLLAEEWAKEKGIHVETKKPDWKRYGKPAGMIRNKEMVDKCGYVCAIWDMKSTGTKGCFNYAKKKNKIVKIYEYSYNRRNKRVS